eukprot:758268-Hanusia_phi.AAC.1
MRPRRGTSESGNTWAFGWARLTLLWGLICRSESLDVLHLEHVMWDNDCMRIFLLGTKTDQAGIGTDLRSNRFKHLYAAPNAPETCPVLAL